MKSTSSGGSSSGSLADGGLASPTQDGGVDQATNSSDLTCLEIFDCVALCPDNDEPCTDACLARGSAGGQAAATDIAQCVQDNACEDETCLTEKCMDSLTACATQKNVTPIQGTAPTGNVPADLVGKWHHFYAPTAHTHDFTFNGDGTAVEYITTTSSGVGCKTSGIGDSTGTVVFTASTFTYYATAGTNAWTTCGKETYEPVTPNSREYGWSFDPDGTLVVVDRGIPDCVANPNLSHCISRFTKQ